MRKIRKHGILAFSIVISYSHLDREIEHTVESMHVALGVYRKAREQGVGKFLVSQPVKPVNRRFN